MKRFFKNLTDEHTKVLGTLDPFQLLDFALHHLGESISTADGFNVETTDSGMLLRVTHVDTCDNKSGSVSDNVLITVMIDQGCLEDDFLWENYRHRNK
jgi:hypothetical protein